MNKIIVFIFLLFPVLVKAFNSPLTDSLLKETQRYQGEEAIEFMIQQYYPVLSQDFEEGLEWLNLALTYAEKIKSEHYKGRSYLCLGSAWYLRGDYEKSFSNYQLALDIFEAENDVKHLGRTYNELSVYYRKQKMWKKALESLDKAFEYCSECNDKECIETSYNNRAVVYELKGSFDTSYFYYKKAEELAIANKNDLGLSYIYSDMAEMERARGNFDQAAINIDLSTAIRVKLGDAQGIAMNQVNKGELYYEKGEYQKSIHLLTTGIEMAYRVKYPDLARNAHEILSQSYNELGLHDSAYFHLERSLFLKDSLLSVEKLQSLSEMEVKYETAKTKQELLETEQGKTLAELQSANKDKWIYGITGILFAGIFLALYLYQRKSKLAEMEKALAIEEERKAGLKAVFDATESERQRIAGDLHDGIGQQMSGLKLAFQNLNSSHNQEKDLEKLNEILDDTAKEIRTISHQMMPKTLKEYGLIPALEDMLEKTFALTGIRCNFETFNIQTRLDERIEISLFRIAQELINNILKHANASQVNIQLFKNKDQLIFMVEDNGVGFDFEKNTGHGQLSIKSRLDTIEGAFHYEKGENGGTIANIRIKIP